MLIYKIINTINNKVYIGLTKLTIEQRFKQHCAKAKKYSQIKNKVSYLYAAMNKYGIEKFKIELIQKCFSMEELIKAEQEQIEIHQSRDSKIGYNLAKGGSGGDCTSIHPNKQKIYENHKKRMSGENNPFYGKTHSRETKEHLSAMRKGIKHTEKQNKKMSIIMTGREITWGDKISEAKTGSGNAMYGKHCTEEHKIKISQKMKGRKQTKEHIENIRAAKAKNKQK